MTMRLMVRILAGLVVLSCCATTDAQARRVRPVPEIVGGNAVGPGEYTSSVAIRYKLDNSPSCSGSVVADYWVLTARHCLENVVLPNLYVRTGRNAAQGQEFEIARSVSHPLAGPDYDVALLRITGKITSPAVVAATLNSGPRPAVGTSVTAVGWGDTNLNPPTSAARLMKDTLQVIACPDGSDRLCALDSRGFSFGTAIGDSGGPLFTGSSSNPIQVGSTSGAVGGLAKTFIPTDKVYNWIQGVIHSTAKNSNGKRRRHRHRT